VAAVVLHGAADADARADGDGREGADYGERRAALRGHFDDAEAGGRAFEGDAKDLSFELYGGGLRHGGAKLALLGTT